MAGLFVVETLVVDPTLFDAYIAVDPAVWWNEQAVVRGAAARFDAWSVPPKRLYVTTGDLPEMQLGVAILLDAVRDHHPAGLELHHDPLPDEHHNTIFPVAALRAFRALFALPPKADRSSSSEQPAAKQLAASSGQARGRRPHARCGPTAHRSLIAAGAPPRRSARR